MMKTRLRPTILIDRIVEDLQTGKLAFPASEGVLLKTYRPNGPLPWREYRQAARIAGASNGTLVLVDDTNKVVIDQLDFNGHYGSKLGDIFVDRAQRRYVNTDARARGSNTALLTLYRLPRGFYLQHPHGFFWDHGEYIGEYRVKTMPDSETV
ncbi:hypothetical protein IOD40_13510 [Aquamicrobium sp. cd-1]|uniref:Uncharacterized protein n=2 Tax=Aquamicrobium zhengzhouense TaxID=2781738 RepID=A0ABS0SEE4_9HYPH|nr:hypothetical protein [Aquamicrobium zhengzhouense]